MGLDAFCWDRIEDDVTRMKQSKFELWRYVPRRESFAQGILEDGSRYLAVIGFSDR